jgi:hypothetical protein
MGATAIALAVGCYVVVTVLLYAVLRPVHPLIALAATVMSLAGLLLDAIRWQPHDINAGMTLHGVFCVLVGWLLFRSMFVPRLLGILMGFAGLVWLLYLIPTLVLRIAPYNSFAGLLGEGLPMLWFLFVGIGDPHSKKLYESSEVVS